MGTTILIYLVIGSIAAAYFAIKSHRKNQEDIKKITESSNRIVVLVDQITNDEKRKHLIPSNKKKYEFLLSEYFTASAIFEERQEDFVILTTDLLVRHHFANNVNKIQSDYNSLIYDDFLNKRIKTAKNKRSISNRTTTPYIKDLELVLA